MPPKHDLPEMKEPPAKRTRSGASTVVPKTIIIPAANPRQQTHAPVSPDVIMPASPTADTLKGNAELSSPAMTVSSSAEDASDESTHTLGSIENADNAHSSATNVDAGLDLAEKPNISCAVRQLPYKIPLKEAPSTTGAMTVGAIVPTEIGCFIDDDRISGCSEALQNRIRAISSYRNEHANTYAIGHLPWTATWGRADPYNDRSKELCDAINYERLTIWIPGHISHVWFLKNGAPDNQCSVSVLPLSDAVGRYADQLICGLSTPALTVSDDLTTVLVRAVRWQSPRNGGSCTLFNSVYDARQILQAKSAMRKFAATDLKKRDLVVLETCLIRYRQKDLGGRWSIFRAQFELQAVYLLQDGPEIDEERVENETEITDLAL
ncbi:hypothetical protein M404DRAFT_25872 [Pisolithus tinctorius Marx 270]|uniref:Uncharacterized protein n=1 Tax=Pisolithus tinctorius Marx 270 TaxID=870435 RepID=A0A0C3PAU6_PISTI|nr:hypothetical protein M404DRAFT_25872 [Pisolithus tinctorius Marx 270]